MKLRKFIELLSVGALLLGLSACGVDASETETEQTVKLGVVGTIYEELWTPAKDKLKEDGINLEFVQFSDYVTPNNALANGEIDLNSFQHEIYLNSEIESYGYEIEPVGYTFIIPLNLYSNKIASIDEIKDGDIIAIPNDVTNGGRALKVLEAAGLIEISRDADFSPTVDDIETYNVAITIEELSANTIPSVLDDVTAGIINGNYALDFGLKTQDAIFEDTSLTEEAYWNIIVAKSSDLEDESNRELYTKIVEAFQTDNTKEVFEQDFGGYFVPVGWDVDLINE